ncbi:galacturonic acid kinase isoform X3 [Wolffia australiana]
MINLENGNNVHEEANWGDYAKGAVFALQKSGKQVTKGITGFICGSEGLDSSGLSSSAAVGIAYLLALEYANTLTLTPVENIELDRIIENEYLGLRNGILDQSAILLSNYGCLTSMNCKTKDYTLVPHPGINKNEKHENGEAFKILLAFSGLKHALTSTNGYNDRVAECQEAARVLLQATGSGDLEPLLCNVDRETYEAHKGKLKPSLAKRAEHFFSENARVTEGQRFILASRDKSSSILRLSHPSSRAQSMGIRRSARVRDPHVCICPELNPELRMRERAAEGSVRGAMASSRGLRSEVQRRWLPRLLRWARGGRPGGDGSPARRARVPAAPTRARRRPPARLLRRPPLQPRSERSPDLISARIQHLCPQRDHDHRMIEVEQSLGFLIHLSPVDPSECGRNPSSASQTCS